MARIQSGGLSNPSPRLDRPTAEAAIAQKNKSYYNAFLKATSAPTVLCNYWSVDSRTSYSESTKNVKMNHDAKKFMLIKEMHIYNYDSEDLEDKTTEDRRLSINLSPKTSFLQPGSILPKEGDHLVIKSQSSIAKPYMVTKVTPLKFLDKEVWNIEYSESTVFTFDELMARTVSTKVYVPNNSGSGGATLLDEDLKPLIDLALSVVDKLQTKYVEQFYDMQMDAVVYKPYEHHDKLHLNYYANDKMQDIHGVLRYGYDKNKLFFQNTYGFDAISENYDQSLYGQLDDKWFEERDEYCPENTNGKVVSDASIALLKALELRERIFAEYRGFPDYTSKYVYSTRLHLRPKVNHQILTRYYNSNVMYVDMFDTAGFFDDKLKRSWVEYEIKSPVICPVLDMYMEDKWDDILAWCKKLKRFSPSKYNIDDFMGIPLMLICINKAIDAKTDSNNKGTYV